MAKGKKTGGIQKGYKYLKTVEFAVRCDEQKFIIAEEFIKLFKESDDNFLKLEILKEMAKYRYAQPKDHEPSADDQDDDDNDNSEQISISDIFNVIDVTPKKLNGSKKS